MAPEISRWRGLAYATLLRGSSLIERAAKGLRYAAAGILTEDEFFQRTRVVYDTYRATDVDALAGLHWWEQDVYDRFLAPGDRVLIIGVGTGRDLLPLARAGHDVVGMDCLAGPLAAAQRHLDAAGLSATLIEGAIEHGLPGAAPFDVVIFSDKTYSLIPLVSRRLAALGHARRLLKPNGRIVVSYFETPEVQPQRSVALHWLAAAATRSGWRLSQHDIVEARGPKGAWLHYYHMFTAREFDEEARAAGLRIVYRREPADPPTVVLAV